MASSESLKVFVGGIPCCITEDAFREVVSEYGEVTYLSYIKDETQQNKGWGFVTYANMAQALNAITELNKSNRFPGGTSPVEARFANMKSTANTNSDATGATSWPAAVVYPRPSGPPTPCVWQQYFTDAGIPYYFHAVQGTTQWHRPPEMDVPQVCTPCTGPYSPMPMKDSNSSGSFGPPGSNLFLFHVPNEWSDMDLLQQFQPFGTILSHRIKKDNEGRNCGYGFVSYDNSVSAINAIRSLDGVFVCKKHLKVQLKKGEEHLLPPDLQAKQQMGGGGNGQRYSPY